MRNPFALKNLLVRGLLWYLRSARDVSRFAWRWYGKRVALIDQRGSLTYRQLEQRVLRLNAAMHGLGVVKGDIVVTWLPESGEQYEIILASYENGAIVAALYPDMSAAVALAMLERLRPKLFIHDPRLSAPIMRQLLQAMPDLRLLAAGPDYERALAERVALRCSVPLSQTDCFSLQMTSGTTGEPKLVGFSHLKYLTTLRLIARAVSVLRPPGGSDVNIIGMPLVGQGYAMILPSLLAGAALVVPQDFGAATLTRLIEKHRVTCMLASPSCLIDLLDAPELGRCDRSSLRQIFYGSEMMPSAKLAEALRRFGPILQQGYGSLEAMPPIAWLLPHEHVDSEGKPVALDVLSSVGRVVPEVAVRIVGEDARVLPTGSAGHIIVKTPAAFEGYWQRPDLTREVLDDGWVRTGDMGYFDDHGYLHVLGRSADRVLRGGAMIHPRLVEEAAHLHPGVKEACLVQSGERALLAVSLRRNASSGTDTEPVCAQIQAFVRAQLAPGLQPDEVRVIAAMPRSFLNKMLRREVRAQFEFEPPTLKEPVPCQRLKSITRPRPNATSAL